MFWILKGPKMAANFINNVINNNGFLKGDNLPGCGPHKSGGYNRLTLRDDDQNGNVYSDDVISSTIGQPENETDLPIGHSYSFQRNQANQNKDLWNESELPIGHSYLFQRNQANQNKDTEAAHCLSSMKIKEEDHNEKKTCYKSSSLHSSSCPPISPFKMDHHSFSGNTSSATSVSTPSATSPVSPEDVEITSFITSDYNDDFASYSSCTSDPDVEDSEPDDEDLTCNVCDRSYATMQQLVSHQMRRRHYGCSICEDIFPTYMALEYHKRVYAHLSEDEEYYDEEEEEEEEEDEEEDLEEEEEEVDEGDEETEGDEDERNNKENDKLI